MKNSIYFASDFHLGIPDKAGSLERELLLVQWLDTIRENAHAIFLMGDLFDFWFEYNTAIPKGYARLLGKLAEITDSGIPVHLFKGNHDMWAFHYLSEEVHIQLHRDPEFQTFGSKNFYLAHGDGLGPGDQGYKLLKSLFACRFNQWLFRWLHPDIGIRMGLYWSRKSRNAARVKASLEDERTIQLIKQRVTTHSRHILATHPDLDYLIYGHYHYPIEEKLPPHATQVVLGDWITHFSYAQFDGKTLTMHRFHGAKDKTAKQTGEK